MPSHSDFSQGYTGQLGEKEEFAIKDPTGGVEGRVEVRSRGASVKFESALSIPNCAESEEGEVEVEGTHEEFT